MAYSQVTEELEMCDLIERLERATGPDRQLDGAIGVVTNPDASLWTPEWWSGGPDEYLRWPDPKPGVARYEQLAHYTASIDAALTLGDIGSLARQKQQPGHPDKWVAVHEPPTKGAMSIAGRHERPAIALCIAAMKARAAVTPRD